jgi:hypothetical protein
MHTVLPECLLGHLFHIKSEILLENHKFHKTFYKMKKNPEYADLLGDIRFCGSSVNPYSEALDEALFNLQFAGVLSRTNPEMVLYSKTAKFDASYSNLVKNLDKGVLDKLNKLSKEFLQSIKTS